MKPPSINSEGFEVPDKTLVVVPNLGIQKEQISPLLESLDGNFKRRLSLGSSTIPLTRGIAVSGNYLYTNSSNQLRVYNKNASGAAGALQIYNLQISVCAYPVGLDVSNDGTKLLVSCNCVNLKSDN